MKALNVILIYTLIGQGFTKPSEDLHLPDVDIFMLDEINAGTSSKSFDVLICENVGQCFEKVVDHCFEVILSMN